MNMPIIEVPNVTGKTVERIAIYDDPGAGRQVTIRFTDKMELAVSITCKQIADIRLINIESDQTFFEHDESTL